MKGEKQFGQRIVFVSLLMLVLTLSVQSVVAIRASEGTITSNIASGGISTSADTLHIIGTQTPLSRFSGTSFLGFFGLNASYSADANPPSITLQTPSNSSLRVNPRTTFTFSASDVSGLAYCVLYIDNAVNASRFGISSGQISISTILLAGVHNWKVACYDNIGNLAVTEHRTMTLLNAPTFDSDTTNLTTSDITNIPSLTLSSSQKGKVKFTSPTNLAGVYDLSTYVKITRMSIFIDSAQLPVLNKPATLTVYDIPYTHIVLLKNDLECTTCNITSFESSTLIFNVSGFSNYSVSSTARLDIYDDSDFESSYGYLKFYANYTNRTSHQVIPDTQCYINFTDESVMMEYNSSTKLFEYARLLSVGVHYYNVSCNASDFDRLTSSDFASIDSFGGPEGVTISNVVSEIPSNATDNISLVGGFINQVNLQAQVPSTAWQGFYGSAMHVVTLSNSMNVSFYNWSNDNPLGEIYATRVSNLNFASLHCSTPANLQAENVYMSLNESHVDNVNFTFNRTSHPAFSVGGIAITQDTCPSTNLFVNGTYQSSQFYEVLMSDGASRTVYVSILEQDAYGFDGGKYDFQMLVGTDGSPAIYYLYAELI